MSTSAIEGVEVCGHRVLLKPAFDENEVQEGSLKGFKLESDESHRRSQAATVTGEVVAVGPTAWKAYDGDFPDWKPWCKVGDVIYFAKYAGKFITVKGAEYIIVNDADIQAILTEGEA